MDENIKILNSELEKANDIVSNINRKLMTEFIQYLTAKSFFINPDISQYSSYPYHPDELVEPLVGDSMAMNVPQRSKKWVAFEDMTLFNNWNSFLADQPPQFKRLSIILLKKPCNYNILTDILNYSNDSGKTNQSSLCGTIKIKQLIIEYNRMTKLYARLGKGICRCLNSCYYRAKHLMVGNTNPQVTGPFSEPEAQLCYKLYKSLQSNSNHTLEYACEQIGKSLNRPPELIGLFVETLEQIKGILMPKMIPSPLKNSLNSLKPMPIALPPLPQIGPQNMGLGPAQIPARSMPISTPVEPYHQAQDINPLLPPGLGLKAFDTSRDLYESRKCISNFTQGITSHRWPCHVNRVLIQVLKWHYRDGLNFDFPALALQVEPEVLYSIISCLQLDWINIFKTLIKCCRELSPHYLDPCLQVFDLYWKCKLMKLFYLNLTDPKNIKRDQAGPTLYEPAYLESFFVRIRISIALNKPEALQHALLGRALTLSNITTKSPLDWCKVTQIHNEGLKADAQMTQDQLVKMFDVMKETYLRNYETMSLRKIIALFRSTLGAGLRRKAMKLASLSEIGESKHALKDLDEPKNFEIIEIENNNEIIEKQTTMGRANESQPLRKSSESLSSEKPLSSNKKVCPKTENSHLNENNMLKEAESSPKTMEKKTPKKIKHELDESAFGKTFEKVDAKSETKLTRKENVNYTPKKPKSEPSENKTEPYYDYSADQELCDMRQSLVENFAKFEKIIKKNRMSLTPEQLRQYDLTLVSFIDKGKSGTEVNPETCKFLQSIEAVSVPKEQFNDVSTPMKIKKVKKSREIKAEESLNIEMGDRILEKEKKPKEKTKTSVKKKYRLEKEKDLDISLKQKPSKSKTNEILDSPTAKMSARKKENSKEETNTTLDSFDREIINELSTEILCKKSSKSKKGELKDSSTEKKTSRKKEKNIDIDEYFKEETVKPETKEMIKTKKLEFDSINLTCELIPGDVIKAIKKDTKSKKTSIIKVDQDANIKSEPSSHKKKHKGKEKVLEECVHVKVKKHKTEVDAPMLNLEIDQDSNNVSVSSKVKKKKRELIEFNEQTESCINESLVEVPRKKKSKKIVEINDDIQTPTPKIKKKRHKNCDVSLETTEQSFSNLKDLQSSQVVSKTPKKSRKIKPESDSGIDSSIVKKADSTNVSDDEPIRILSPAKINVTRDNAKKHLVITIEDSDDICEIEDDQQARGTDKIKSIDSIKLQKLIEALGNNPNNQFRIINEIRKAVVKSRSIS